MMSTTTSACSKQSIPLLPGSKCEVHEPLHVTVEESLLQINNDSVSLLQVGNNKAAMIRLARGLAIMRTRSVEGDKEVHYQFTKQVRPSTLLDYSLSTSRYIFAAPLIVVPHGAGYSNETSHLTCKLLSLILFNLSLAHHLYALELLETIRAQDKLRRRQEVCDLLEKSLRLYELCHSSLVFTNSGLLCSDLSIAVVVTNNVGEIHKELHNQLDQHQDFSRTAIACSDQLVQIFMFFAANGASNKLDGFGDILSNAMTTLNGPHIAAPAA